MDKNAKFGLILRRCGTEWLELILEWANSSYNIEPSHRRSATARITSEGGIYLILLSLLLYHISGGILGWKNNMGSAAASSHAMCSTLAEEHLIYG